MRLAGREARMRKQECRLENFKRKRTLRDTILFKDSVSNAQNI